MTGAAIATASVGVASLAQGVKESKKAGESGDRAIDAAMQNVGVAGDLNKYLQELGGEGVEYAQGLMDNWEATFGGIQDNLADYYQNLDPNKYATQAKSDYMANMDKQMKQFNDTMASSGLQSAGMKQQAAQEASFATAQGNAAIDLGAEDKVRGMQQGFVNSGEAQRSQATNFMDSAMGRQGQYASIGGNAMMNANTGIANAYSNQAGGYGQSAAGYAGAGGSLMGSALGLGLLGGGNKTVKPTWENGYAGSGQEDISGPRRPNGRL